MAIELEINKSSAEVFRRAYIKRRSETSGLYESSWYEITEFVKDWGSVSRSIDDLRLNIFQHSGFDLLVRNDTGAFNNEISFNSLWHGYLSRYRTLIKLEAGYIDENDAELPTDTTLGVFIMNDEIPISGINNSASLRCKSLMSVFNEVKISDVSGIYTTLTASELIAKIRDHTDGSSNFILRQFITSTAWTIQSTSNYYVFTSEKAGSITCWDFMQKLAEGEGYVLLINRTGGIEFRDRDERTSTSQFTFSGQGFSDQNVIQLIEYKESLNKYFNFFRLQYLEPDTSTSFVTAGTTTTVDPSSTAWKYGTRQYDFKLTFPTNTTTAQSIVNNLYSRFNLLKNEIKIKTKFAPQLEISDKVLLNYHSYDTAGQTLWDVFLWDTDSWASEQGENFDFDNQPFKIISLNHDLNTLATNITLRDI